MPPILIVQTDCIIAAKREILLEKEFYRNIIKFTLKQITEKLRETRRMFIIVHELRQMISALDAQNELLKV